MPDTQPINRYPQHYITRYSLQEFETEILPHPLNHKRYLYHESVEQYAELQQHAKLSIKADSKCNHFVQNG